MRKSTPVRFIFLICVFALAITACHKHNSTVNTTSFKYGGKVTAMIGLAPVCSLESMCDTKFGSDVVRAYSEPIPKRVSLSTH